MPENITAHTLAKYLKTQQKAQSLVTELDNVLSIIYNPTLNAQDVNQVSSAHPILKSIVDGEMFEQTQIIDKAFIDEIKAKLNTIKTLHVVLASNNDRTVDLLHDWAVENVPEPVIAKVTQETGVLGGVQLVYEGLYKDWTLKEQVKNYLERTHAIEQ